MSTKWKRPTHKCYFYYNSDALTLESPHVETANEYEMYLKLFMQVPLYFFL